MTDDTLRIEGRRLLFEVRIIMESVAQGLENLQARPEALFIREELGVLRKLTTQAAEAVETFGDVLEGRNL
jgi:hypothetical protein